MEVSHYRDEDRIFRKVPSSYWTMLSVYVITLFTILIVWYWRLSPYQWIAFLVLFVGGIINLVLNIGEMKSGKALRYLHMGGIGIHALWIYLGMAGILEYIGLYLPLTQR